MGSESIIIPVRFLTLLGHMTALFMLFWTKTDNVLASLSSEYSQNEFEDKEDSLLAAVWLSIICGAIETIGLLGGFSMFLMANNVLSIMLSWFILESWNIAVLWYIFVFFSLFPAMVEIWAILRIFWCKVIQY